MVTTPGGKSIHTRGRANKIGHFHRPEDDFVVDEPGMYTVQVRVTHDGDTSAGPVEKPYPTGSVLGAAEGRFRFYVVPKDKPTLLQVDTPPLGLRLSHDAGRHPRRGLKIVARVPSGIFEPRAWVSVNCGGTVIAEGPLKISDGRFLYTYDLHELRKTFTNLDQEPSDTVAITLCVTGKNVAGEPTAAARQILLQGRDVYAPE